MFIVRWISKKLRSKKLWVFVIIICLIIVGFLHVKNALNAPSIGTVNLQTSQTMGGNKAPVAPISYKGTYLSLTYPARYRQTNTPLTGTILEVLSLYSKDNTEISVTIGVTKGYFQNDSGVTLRQNKTQVYKTLSTHLAGTLSFESTNNGQNGYERDEFINHNNMEASIVMTAPSKAIIGTDFDSIVSSLKWQ